MMAMVVTEPRFGCKYTDCVVVCPCDCFREGESMLFIDPEECIDCDACVPECPVSAIFYQDSVPQNGKTTSPSTAKWPPCARRLWRRKHPCVNDGLAMVP